MFTVRNAFSFFFFCFCRDLLFETPQIPTHGESTTDTAQRVSWEVSGGEQAVSPSQQMQECVCVFVCGWHFSCDIPVVDTSCAVQVVVGGG